MSVIKERVNVASLAKAYKEDEYQTDLTSSTGFSTLPLGDSEEARVMWAEYKPEQYALGAVFADLVVRTAYEAREVNEMVDAVAKDQSPFGPIFALGQKIRQEVIASIRWNCERVEKGEDPRLLPSYRRLERLVELEHRLIPENRTMSGVKNYLEGGTNTAVETMSNILMVIVQLVGSIEDPQRLLKIAENSFPLVAKFASSHGQAVVRVINAFKGSPFPFIPYDSECFSLEEAHGNERLVFSERGKDRVETVTGVRNFEDFRTDTPVIGCIAMVNFGDGSAVKRLWDWHLEASRTMFPRFRPGPPPR